MDARKISEMLLSAGKDISEARALVLAEMEGLKSQVVAAVIDSKKVSKLDNYGHELRIAADMVGNLELALSQLERTYLAINSDGIGKKKVARKGGAPLANKAIATTPDVPPALPTKVKRLRAAPGKAIELVWSQVQAKVSSEWTTLPRAEVAKLAGVSIASVNIALKKFVSDGKLVHQGREYKLP